MSGHGAEGGSVMPLLLNLLALGADAGRRFVVPPALSFRKGLKRRLAQPIVSE